MIILVKFLFVSSNENELLEALYETRLKIGAIALRPLLETQERTRTTENVLTDNRLARLLNEATLYRALGGE